LPGARLSGVWGRNLNGRRRSHREVDGVGADMADWARYSAVRVMPAVQPRKLAKVPFVGLAEGRVPGGVSSGSDIERVYVSSIMAGTHSYHCSTNNNRPCGGLRGSPCKHLRVLVEEAVRQYGVDRVARYLGVEVEDGANLVDRLHGGHER